MEQHENDELNENQEEIEEQEQQVDINNETNYSKYFKLFLSIISIFALAIMTLNFMNHGTFMGYMIIRQEDWGLLKLRHESLIKELVVIKQSMNNLMDTNKKIKEKLDLSNNLSNSIKKDKKDEIDNIVNDIIDIIKAGKELQIDEMGIKKYIEKRFQTSALINSDFWKKGDYWNLIFSNESKMDYNPMNVERWIREIKIGR